jgi:acyl carrier protein
MTVKERVKRVLGSVLGVPADEIVDESSPDTIGTWDSLNHMNLVMALEQEFGIRFSEDQIVDLLSCEIIEATTQELLSQSGRDTPAASGAGRRSFG